MQFKVPKFIEMESKIFGPLTFKQFLYVGGGAGVVYVLFKILPIVVSLPVIIAVAFLAWSLAFTRRDKYGKPFVEVTEAAFKFFVNTKLYTWKRTPKKIKKIESEYDVQKEPLLSIPKITTGKLSDKINNLEIQENDKIINEESSLSGNQ